MLKENSVALLLVLSKFIIIIIIIITAIVRLVGTRAATRVGISNEDFNQYAPERSPSNYFYRIGPLRARAIASGYLRNYPPCLHADSAVEEMAGERNAVNEDLTSQSYRQSIFAAAAARITADQSALMRARLAVASEKTTVISGCIPRNVDAY